MNRARNKQNGRFESEHGMKSHPLYSVWCSMKSRCNNPHNSCYERYGERGITVCEEWSKSFISFLEWAMDNGYEKGLTIDRINNDGNYEPSNCRWVTTAVQNRNYSRNHNITYNGKTMCIVDWEKETGIRRATILWRLRNGKSLDEVFSKKDGRSLRWVGKETRQKKSRPGTLLKTFTA